MQRTLAVRASPGADLLCQGAVGDLEETKELDRKSGRV